MGKVTKITKIDISMDEMELEILIGKDISLFIERDRER